MTHNTEYRPTSSTIEATDRRWSTWPDWVNLIIGAYIALAPLWTTGAPGGWFVTLGLLVAAASLWALATASTPASEWSAVILGAVLFLAPWMGGFASVSAAAWTAWIAGVAIIVFAGIAMSKRKELMR